MTQIGEIVLVNIGAVEEELRPAIVCKDEGGRVALHLFIAWKDVPLAAGVGAHSSSVGYMVDGAVEGRGTGQFRRMEATDGSA